jgi:hypothetical protein
LAGAHGAAEILEEGLAEGIGGEFGGGSGEGGDEGVEEGGSIGGELVRVLVFFVGAEGVERGEIGDDGGAGSVIGDLGGGEGGGGVEDVLWGSGDLVGGVGETLIFEDGGDGRGSYLVKARLKRLLYVGVVAQENVARVAVLKCAEGDSELGGGLGTGALDLGRFSFVDGFTGCFLKAEVCRILETQENIVGICRLKIGNSVDKYGSLVSFSFKSVHRETLGLLQSSRHPG